MKVGIMKTICLLALALLTLSACQDQDAPNPMLQGINNAYDCHDQGIKRDECIAIWKAQTK
jgi:outer membrane lipoprotein-sorting protein